MAVTATRKGGEQMHQQIAFSHMIVRYDTLDRGLAVVVCYATSLEEAQVLLSVFTQLAPYFAPTALYALRTIEAAGLYEKGC
jgi:hypothetical protein